MSHLMFLSSLWGRGFRPFFLCAALYSVINLIIWGGFYAGHITPPDFFFDPVSWHAHEMIFGCTMAVISGFLLTAVANWTGTSPIKNFHLGTLCALWFFGRMTANFDVGLPSWALIAIEGGFIPVLAISLAKPLIQTQNKRNFIFMILLALLWGFDMWFMITMNNLSLHLSIMVILIMISLIGGRIIPNFTIGALRRKGYDLTQTPQIKMDIAALVSLLLIALCFVFDQTTYALSLCAFLSLSIHALRMRHYHTLKTLDNPLLWILHLGYIWLLIGLFLLFLNGLGAVSFSTALHALTAGCIGTMVLGMICRVSLGHTGRDLCACRFTNIAFITIQISALTRVFAPLIDPENTINWILISSTLWSASFGIFLFVYTPMLIKPRPDGKPA